MSSKWTSHTYQFQNTLEMSHPVITITWVIHKLSNLKCFLINNIYKCYWLIMICVVHSLMTFTDLMFWLFQLLLAPIAFISVKLIPVQNSKMIFRFFFCNYSWPIERNMYVVSWQNSLSRTMIFRDRPEMVKFHHWLYMQK